MIRVSANTINTFITTFGESCSGSTPFYYSLQIENQSSKEICNIFVSNSSDYENYDELTLTITGSSEHLSGITNLQSGEYFYQAYQMTTPNQTASTYYVSTTPVERGILEVISTGATTTYHETSINITSYKNPPKR